MNYKKISLLTRITTFIFFAHTFFQTVDNSFGVNDKVTNIFGATYSNSTDITVLYDNQIITCSYSYVGFGSKPCISLCKFKADESFTQVLEQMAK